jgi:ActR/RegA family two-component response regulator
LETENKEKTMLAQTERIPGQRPLLVLAYGDSTYASLAGRSFRRLGWEVHLASSGTEARRLARTLSPIVVVLDTDLADESGWLTCDKLKRERPGQKVVLVSPNPTEECRRQAEFVGAAALVCRGGGVHTLIEEVLGKSLQAVG